MNEQGRRNERFSSQEDIGDQECPTCGNAKSLKACVVCHGEMVRHELRNRKDRPGKPLSGPGSDEWEDLGKRLSRK